jgi:hypothetical protein
MALKLAATNPERRRYGEINMTALTVSALTEQQRDLVRYLVGEGRPPEEAAKLAGSSKIGV